MNRPAAQVAAPAIECSHDDLIRLREMIYRVAGIFHPDNKLSLLEERCRRRMATVKVRSLGEYLEKLTNRLSGHAELASLLNEITIGETSFFRNRPQLEAMRRVVIPRLLAAKSQEPSRALRVWSAGCSTGEEPYTLRMTMLEEADGRLKDWAVEIIATDINEHSLAHAQRAVYGAHSTRNVTASQKEKYFAQCGDELQVRPLVRSGVSFSRVNLSDDKRMAMLKRMDIILCCNVLIYFDLASKQRVIRHFYNNLSPHGYLFLGHSESLYGVSKEFRLMHLPGATAYVKADVPSSDVR